MPNLSPTDAIIALLGLYLVYLPVIAVVVSLVGTLRLRRPRSRGAVIEIWLQNYTLYGIALLFLFNFVYHTVFADLSARFIGWANSPFQIEVGTASLGMALVGFLAVVKRQWILRLAAWLAMAPFLWGAGIGHIVDIIRTQNFAPGNAGFVLYVDFLLPAGGLLLLWLSHRHPVHHAEPVPDRAEARR